MKKLSIKVIALSMILSIISILPISAEGQSVEIFDGNEIQLTFEEMVKQIADRDQIPVKTIIDDMVNNEINDKQTEYQTAILLSSKSVEELALENLNARGYATNSWRLYVVDSLFSKYHPTLHIYFETNNNYGAKTILNVQIDRGHRGGTSKYQNFAGEVYTNLESSSKVFWTVNGNFIDGGAQIGTTSASVSVGVGKYVTVSFSVSVSGSPKTTYYSVRHNRDIYYGACPMTPSFDDLICGKAK